MKNLAPLLEDKTVQRVVFHFNKAYLTDPTIPMWVIKHKGVSHYVDHVDSEVSFQTKNTPDNEHTKGSIMLRGTLLIVEEDGKKCAFIRSGTKS